MMRRQWGLSAVSLQPRLILGGGTSINVPMLTLETRESPGRSYALLGRVLRRLPRSATTRGMNTTRKTFHASSVDGLPCVKMPDGFIYENNRWVFG
eukprot:2276315-Pyramimonas_sp.AAC.1